MENVIVKSLGGSNESKGKVTLLNLPTGYGKTRVSIILGKAVSDNYVDAFSRVIHMVPSRGLVEGILRHAETIGVRSPVQYLFINPAPSTLRYIKPFTVMNTDLYLFNFVRIHVTGLRYGLGKKLRSILNSALNFIDEYNFFSTSGFCCSDRGEYVEALRLITTSLLFMVKYTISNSITDLVLSTSSPTLTPELLRSILGIEADRVIEVSFDLSSKIGVSVNGSRVLVNDDEFNNDRFNKSIVTKVVKASIKDMVRKCVEVFESGGKCLMVLNTFRRVIDAYEYLCSLISCRDVALIHSRFRVKERSLVSEKVKSIDVRGRGVVISSPDIEVGIDFDADVLVSDAAPITSLIQRSGRLLRRVDDSVREGEFIIVFSEELLDEGHGTYAGVYPANITLRSIDAINKVVSSGVLIDWKLMFTGRVGNRISYTSLITPAIPQNYVKYLVDRDCLSVLMKLSSTQIASLEELGKVEEFLTNFMNYYPLIPLFIPNEDLDYDDLKAIIDIYYDDLPNYLLPIELSLNTLNLLGDTLISKDGDRIALIVEDREGDLDITFIKYNYLMKIFRRGYIRRGNKVYFPVALICRPKYYEEGTGLKLFNH